MSFYNFTLETFRYMKNLRINVHTAAQTQKSGIENV